VNLSSAFESILKWAHLLRRWAGSKVAVAADLLFFKPRCWVVSQVVRMALQSLIGWFN
jgi:hypothetical protein